MANERPLTAMRFWATVGTDLVDVRFLVILSSLAVLLFAVACSSSQDSSTREHPDLRTAPDFTLPAADGSEISLEQLRNRRHVLLYFHMGYG